MAAQIYAACGKCLRLNKISLERAESQRPVCGACGAPVDVQHGIFNADSRQLQKLIEKSPLPVIVDFWAPWCAPCRSFAPTFERVAREHPGQAVFVKVNTEIDVSASQAFQVRGIPTLAAFRGGREVDRQSGALPYDHFTRWVNQFTQKSNESRSSHGVR